MTTTIVLNETEIPILIEGRSQGVTLTDAQIVEVQRLLSANPRLTIPKAVRAFRESIRESA